MDLTPIEKAKYLVHHFKESAIIVVEEVSKELPMLEYHPLGSYTNPKIEYWQDVKKEVEKEIEKL